MDLSVFRIALSVLAYGLFAYGACGLVALWQFPEIARSRLYGRVLTGRLPATDRNRALAMVHSLLGGLLFTLILARQLLLASMIVAPYMMVSFALARVGRQVQQPSHQL